MEKYLDIKQQKQIKKEILNEYNEEISTFKEKCQIGENDSNICSLIRSDSVEEFITYVNRTNLSLLTKIKPSVYETHSYLIDNEPTLIEYESFFGSIQIIRYLKFNNVPLTSSLWLYTVHSNNSELIHFLEENDVSLRNNENMFFSDYSGTIHNIKMRSFSHESITNSQLHTTFSFDEKAENGNNKISRFKIDKYLFVVDLSKFDKENKAIVEVSISIDDKDSSLISSKNNYIVTRTREFESKQFLEQKQQSKGSKETIKEFSHETIDTKIVNKIKKILSDMEINIPNNYIIFIIAVFFVLIVFLISKIVTDCLIANQTRKSTKTTGKKVKKHKKKAPH